MANTVVSSHKVTEFKQLPEVTMGDRKPPDDMIEMMGERLTIDMCSFLYQRDKSV